MLAEPKSLGDLHFQLTVRSVRRQLSALTLMVFPTKPNTPSPVELIFSASSSARWSAQRIMFQSPGWPRLASLSASWLAPIRLTLTGLPVLSVTAKEQVASNPMPLTADGATPEDARTVLQHLESDAQMSLVDCSKIL